MSNNNKSPGCIELLSRFSPTEMGEFLQFVQCRYFNTDKKIIILTTFLKDIFFAKGVKTFDETVRLRAFKAVFPDIPAEKIHEKQTQLTNKLGIIRQLGLRFLQVKALETDSAESAKLLYQELSKRELSASFKKQQRDDRKKLDKIKQKGDTYYHRKYQIERAEYKYRFKIEKLINDDNLPEVIEALDIGYLIERFMLQLEGMALMSVSSRSHDYDTKAIINLSEHPHYSQIPIISICRTAYDMEYSKFQYIQLNNQQSDEADDANKKSEQCFSKLVELLELHSEELPNDMLSNLYTLVTNFCTHQVKLQALSYSRKAFEVYQQIDKKGLLVTDGKIRIGKLNSMIVAACQTKEFSWAKNTLSTYKDYIHLPIRESFNCFLLGLIEFYQGNFVKAEKYFEESQDKQAALKYEERVHQRYLMNARILALKCVYEGGYGTTYTESKINRDIKFMRENKLIPSKDKRGQINFINTVNNLYKIKSKIGYDKPETISKRLEKVKNNIDGFDFISDVRWLLEKITELEKTK